MLLLKHAISEQVAVQNCSQSHFAVNRLVSCSRNPTRDCSVAGQAGVLAQLHLLFHGERNQSWSMKQTPEKPPFTCGLHLGLFIVFYNGEQLSARVALGRWSSLVCGPHLSSIRTWAQEFVFLVYNHITIQYTILIHCHIERIPHCLLCSLWCASIGCLSWFQFFLSCLSHSRVGL